jgi:ankyrin repeat protein
MEEGVGNIRLDSSSESDPSSSLLNAARKGDAKEVKRLLSDVLSPDSPLTQSGRTLLHVSAHHGHLGVLLLVASNSEKWGPANPNVINKSGHTPLHEACAQGRTEVVHFLLSQGALVNAAAKDGTTCLMLASHGGHVTTTKILISSGADVNSANLRGWTAAHFCAYKGDVQMVKLLVFHGCDVERRSNDGKWAGAIAEEEGHMECTEELKKARGLVSMATESRVVALEGRLALAEEALRNLQEESDQLISSNVEEVRTQYEDLFTSLKEQLVEKESEIAQLRNLKSKQALLPKVEPKAANSAPSSPHPHR